MLNKMRHDVCKPEVHWWFHGANKHKLQPQTEKDDPQIGKQHKVKLNLKNF